MKTEPPPNEVGILGLGLMGTALAERFLEAGCRVRVWNRTPAKAELLIARGAEWSSHPLAAGGRVVVCLYTSEIVATVLDAMDGDWRPNTTIIDTTTGEPRQVDALGARLAARGIQYIDAPISGSSVQTRRGEATVLVGATEEIFAACADLWRVMGATVVRCGNVGSAARMKLITNLVLGLNRAALAEGLAFAESLGVEPGAALGALSASMAYSRVMDVKGRKMIERDFAVQARLAQHLKDVRIILETGKAAGLVLPLSEVHRRLLEQAEAMGWGEADNSAIVEAFRNRVMK